MKKVVFMGDSITAGFELLNQYEHIKNLGVGGNKTTESIPLIKTTRLEQPDVLFLMIGINDFLCNKRFWPHGYTIPFYKTYDVLLDLIAINLPKTKLHLISILPIGLQSEGLLNYENAISFNIELDSINQFIKEKAKIYKANYIDLNRVFKQEGLMIDAYSSDGIHLNGLGYEVFLDHLKSIEPEIFI